MHNLSLVGFTLLNQASVGAVLVVVVSWIITAVTGAAWPAGDSDLVWLAAVQTLFCMGGLFSAVFHLGRPLTAWRVLGNLGSSWLSREIICFSLYSMLLASCLFTAWRGWAAPALWPAAGVVGLVGLFAMSRVYRLRTVPVWNQSVTPLDFFASALLLGGAMNRLCLVFLLDEAKAFSAAPLIGVVFIISGWFLMTGLVLKMISTLLWLRASSSPTGFVVLRALFIITGALVLAALGWQHSMADRLAALSASAFLLLGEFWGRWGFYSGYRRLGV